MRRAGQIADGHAGFYRHADVERRCGPFALAQVGICHPAVGGSASALFRAGIARPHHGGINKFINAIGGHEQFRIAQLDENPVAGHNIGDVHLEHVGTVLLQKRSVFARVARLFVLPPCLIALFDFRLDDALADRHLHAVNRGAGRGRKNVDRFERLLSVVFVNLRYHHIGEDAGDRHPGRRGLKRQAIRVRISARHKEIRRFGPILTVAGLGVRPSAGKPDKKRRHERHPTQELFHNRPPLRKCLFLTF